MEWTIKPIGVVRTPYASKSECPVQGQARPEAKGTVEVDEAYLPALDSIELFSHLYLIYVFDRAGAVELRRKPFLDDAAHGLFATRHPCRPNPLGLSIVRLLGRSGHVLHVAEVDMLDKTPIIDIKPYVPRFDERADATNGWLQKADLSDKPAGRE